MGGLKLLTILKGEETTKPKEQLQTTMAYMSLGMANANRIVTDNFKDMSKAHKRIQLYSMYVRMRMRESSYIQLFYIFKYHFLYLAKFYFRCSNEITIDRQQEI